MKPREKDFEVARSALGKDLHPPSDQIAAPAGDPEVGGSALSRPAEADTLNEAIDVNPYGSYI